MFEHPRPRPKPKLQKFDLETSSPVTNRVNALLRRFVTTYDKVKSQVKSEKYLHKRENKRQQKIESPVEAASNRRGSWSC